MTNSLLKNNYADSFLKDTFLNNKLFDKFLKSNLTDIQYIYLSSNPTINTIQISRLFQKNIDNVNINLLRNKNCPQDKINDFLTYNDKIYNIAIAHNPSINQEIIQKLVDFNDKDVNMSLEFSNLI